MQYLHDEAPKQQSMVISLETDDDLSLGVRIPTSTLDMLCFLSSVYLAHLPIADEPLLTR